MRYVTLALLLFAVASGTANAEVVFDWATVGNAGNENDSHGFGGVPYNYRISKHEVTNDQYAEFLNKVASTSDPNGLFNSSMDITQTSSGGGFSYTVNARFETRPVKGVSFFDAMRFVNWLENGQVSSGTESGVYSIGTGLNETRAGNATYFIPSENEWYKAAYHDPNAVGSYWDYPTQSNTAPTASSDPSGSNNANMNFAVGDTTVVGSYTGSASFYGTFDQAGNLWEWNEAVISSSRRGLRGGGFENDTFGSAASIRNPHPPGGEGYGIGFRVASIPEPSAGVLAMLAVVGLGAFRRRRSR